MNAAFGCLVAVLEPRSATAAVDFARDVQPILTAACHKCHGRDKHMGKLRLDTRRLAQKGGASGPVIVPGKSVDSRLYQAIVDPDPDERMPRKADALPAEQIAVIRAWIDQGAVWPDAVAGAEGDDRHWAYVTPTRPPVPRVTDVRRRWVRNPIDAFVLARLEKEGLAPSPEAPKETLLRRLFLDVIGLAPQPADIRAFLADRSPRAYEKVVERLLASPHFGERWARPWLDLARYADTNGYEKDSRRSIWKYRDWVIDAFNRDLPFDELTIQQIAGDMLPGATQDTRIATGFHRNTMANEEAGVDPDEAMYERIVDRVNTTATVWLGSTLGCAQCHDHKYDPFTQRDYFRLYAFFANTDFERLGKEAAMRYSYREPVLDLPTPEQERRRRALQAEIDRVQAEIARAAKHLGPARAAWEQEVAAAEKSFVVIAPSRLASTGGAKLERLGDGSALATGANALEDTYVIEGETDLAQITALRIETLLDDRLPKSGPGRDPHGNFVLNGVELRVRPRDGSAASELIAWKDALADDHNPDDGLVGALVPRHLIDRPDRGWGIDATTDERRVPRQLVMVPVRPFGHVGGSVLDLRLRHASRDGAQGIGRVRISVTGTASPGIVVSAPAPLRPLLATPASRRTPEEQGRLAEHYESIAPALDPLRGQIRRHRKAIADLNIATTLVMRERPATGPPSAHLRVRGAFLEKGERVVAGVPAALPSIPEGVPHNRLGLARWLASRENPLGARVTVNRLWEQYFGRGIVETSEDFGSQGERPSHPELLDWLATELHERNGSLKAIYRLIVTSAAYRQAARATPGLIEKDPHNRLLGRGPRFRMEGEMIRDLALSASGLLSREVGGPSVFPYQPDGIWDIPYNSDQWRMSDGGGRHRRALYTFWRRSAPYPSMITFDATSREVCTVRRVRTNTPLQALTTLNDPAFFDTARALARRMVRETGPDARRRAAHGFQLAATRAPTPAEAGELVALYHREIARLRGDPAAVRALVGGNGPAATGLEIAAWTVVANVILNLDEVITKN